MNAAWWQYPLPQNSLSWLAGSVARSRVGWFKDRLIRAFVRHYDVDMSDAACPDLSAYPSFEEFFTRALRSDARPVASGEDLLSSPADGTLSEFGQLRDGQLLQAKGRRYAAADLLDSAETATRFAQGSYATVYLAPRDYHRVHMPVSGQLSWARYVPGSLFSVNRTTAASVPGLFARNERVVSVFETDQGALAVVMVGALIVAGIQMAWPLAQRDASLGLARGEEMGRFRFGSTVLALTERPLAWRADLARGAPLRMGQALGSWPPDGSGVPEALD